jgi:hypothetical protein
MVQRGFCGVNSLSTSQALSRVVEVAQGVFLLTVFGFGLELRGRRLLSCDSRCLDFDLLTIYFRFTIALSCHIPIGRYLLEHIVVCAAKLDFKRCFFPFRDFSAFSFSSSRLENFRFYP